MREKLTFVLLLVSLCMQAQVAGRYDVVIDEIMADPSPVVGLPNYEFIELKNVSLQPVNLNGWQIGDETGAATIKINFTLQPDSFVIVCSTAAAASLSLFGTTIGVSSFPSLDNTGDRLYVLSKEGVTIHAVSYSDTWYRNAVKLQGGWTLEMIDTKNPCGAAINWTASNNPSGGTPGKKNSVDAMHRDLESPALLRAYAESNTITLYFDEPVDSTSAVNISSYTISDGIGKPLSIILPAPFFDKVQLQISGQLQPNKIHSITVKNIADCSGNSIGSSNTAKFGIAADAGVNDLVINEILFNPKPDAVDYIECYNRSDKIVNLKNYYIANRSNGIIGTPRPICTDNRLMFPGDYLLLTESASAVQKQYLVKYPETFAIISSMPSMPDDKGDIVVLNIQGSIIDELRYDEHWQFKLLDNNEGVALERIDYNKPTQDPDNWHSAATDAGYGTPGYQNSQYRINLPLPGDITVDPTVFSPDNDGFNDFLTINYQFPEPGYTCNITVFDASGKPARFLTRNALCGMQGSFRWDGLNQQFGKLPMGVYIVYAEVFNLKGKTARFKKAVTLARKF